MDYEKNKRRDILVLSGTLFSMFFGAGNLIFPPSLGFNAGKLWIISFIGFFLTGTGLPLLGIIASAKSEGDINKLGERVSPLFSKFLGIVVILSIGPLMAIPRTGATSFEMAILPIFPDFSPIVFAIIYFGIAFLLVINPVDIVDRVGKVLTPALVILLLAIILLGILNPMGELVDTGIKNPFIEGFEGGYQTMDAFAALLFGGVIISSIKERGYSDLKTQTSMTLKAGLYSTLGLTIIYGGLTYLGATGVEVLDPEISKVNLIMKIADNSLKSFGTIGMSIVVTLACLTTTIGLISTVGQYFEDLSKGKLSYRFVIIITTIFSAVLSVIGVDEIVKFSGPVLSFMYPIVIVLIILTVFSPDNMNKNIYKYSVMTTLVFSLIESLGSIFNIEIFLNIISYLPFQSIGLFWILPGIIGGILGSLIKETDVDK